MLYALALRPEILIVAVEASADLHAARALEALRRLRPDVAAFGAGGPRLRAAGLEAVARAEDLCAMGFAEVLPRLPALARALRRLASAAAARGPALALLVDAPDFNLRLARRLRRLGVPVVCYVAPMAWAWRPGRARQLARLAARLLCILPFEEAFFAARGVRARFVGHPLLDGPDPAPARGCRAALGLAEGRPTLALLPGSRPAEVRRLLGPMLAAAERLRAARPDLQLQVVVAQAPTLSADALAPRLARHPGPVALGSAELALGAADVALVKSGTGVLEAALRGVPMVVAYRLAWPSWALARLLVRVRHASLVNLLAGRAVVPELLQRDATAERMAAEVERLLADGAAREAQRAAFREVRAGLGPAGASGRVAAELAGMLPAGART